MTYADTIIADAPIRYYRLEEASGSVAADEMGNFDGTIVGTPIYHEPSLVECPGYSMKSNTAYVEGVESLSITAFTIECWVKIPTSESSVQGYFSGFTFDGFNHNELWQLYHDVNGAFTWRKRFGNSLTSANGFNDGTRHFLVATATSGGNMELFVDATSVGTQSAGTFTYLTNDKWRFMYGNGRDGGANWMDECTIYDYVLTSSQVTAHYIARLCSRPYWGLLAG